MTGPTPDQIESTLRTLTPGQPLELTRSSGSDGCWLVVGGQPLVELSDDEIDRLGFEADSTWSSDLAERIRVTLRRRDARRVALRLLARRARSRGELVERLARDGHDESTAAAVTDELQRRGLLDDDDLAESIARATRRRGGVGPARLEQRLRARKLDDERVRTSLAAAFGDVDLVAEALRVAEPRLPRLRGDRVARIRRLAALLARRGFDEPTITEALRRLGLDPDDPS